MLLEYPAHRIDRDKNIANNTITFFIENTLLHQIAFRKEKINYTEAEGVKVNVSFTVAEYTSLPDV